MAAKTVSITPQEPMPKVGEDLFFVAMPMETYRAISDSAKDRGMTFGQAMQQAMQRWMDQKTSEPQLLLEKEETPK